ncbi:ABC transporter substrate-binding protein, partial [Chloroflexota bacterium]
NLQVFFKPADHLISATALDRYTVELKFPAAAMAIHVMEDSCRIPILPPDTTEMYGDQNEWELSNGTGPFMLTDYVVGSSLTYERNPNYWETNPAGLGKGDQLPYFDGIVQLLITDLSSQQAAFRTGQVDRLNAVTWEDAELLLSQRPDMVASKSYGRNYIPTGRVDKLDLPFQYREVRRALNLAVDQQEIVDKYYQGNAFLMGWPFYDNLAAADFYTPLEEMPASVQELFTQDIDKAKELLDSVGYGEGFKTEIACISSQVDFLSMIREYLLEINVDMEIKPLENSVFNSVKAARTHEEMIYLATTFYWGPWLMHETRVDSSGCASYWEDEESLRVYDIINRNLGTNDALWVKELHDVVPHLLDEAWGIFVPAPYLYNMWWPWLKNYYGCVSGGYAQGSQYIRYGWIDTDLKASMGY